MRSTTRLIIIVVVLSVYLIITVAVINPLWKHLSLHVPGEPNSIIDFTQPVDTVFYLRNSERGYLWDVQQPTSLWFHPLLSWLITIFPSQIPANWRLWVLEILMAILAVEFVIEYAEEITGTTIGVWPLIVFPFIPGMLGISTGNAEIPCLFFTSLLLLSIIRRKNIIWVSALGALAILTKPNALYMVPGIFAYLISGFKSKDNNKALTAFFAIGGLLIAWLSWIIYVDIMVGRIGSYWDARAFGSTAPVLTGPFSFMLLFTQTIVYSANAGDKLNYIFALTLPLIDMWILLVIPTVDDDHKYSILSSLFSVLAINLLINNPNKTIVYITTIPGHLAVGLLFFQHTLAKKTGISVEDNIFRKLAGLSYLLLCGVTSVFYVLGTPLEWYY
jgi:hypothetical protein